MSKLNFTLKRNFISVLLLRTTRIRDIRQVFWKFWLFEPRIRRINSVIAQSTMPSKSRRPKSLGIFNQSNHHKGKSYLFWTNCLVFSFDRLLYLLWLSLPRLGNHRKGLRILLKSLEKLWKHWKIHKSRTV